MKELDFTQNMGMIFIYKSDRKNSKSSDLINVYHLISTGDNKPYINDDAIERYLVDTIESCLYAMDKMHTRTINCTMYTSLRKQTRYLNANNEWYYHNSIINFDNKRRHFSSFEDFINFMYSQFMLIYPYSKLDIKELYNNIHLNHLISKYYNHR